MSYRHKVLQDSSFFVLYAGNDTETDAAETAARIKETDEQNELKNERMLKEKRHDAS